MSCKKRSSRCGGARAAIGRRGPGAAGCGASRAWLYVVSRRVPAALCLLAALGAILAVALHWHWSIAGGPAARQVVPLVIESRAAAVIATATYGPLGESERAAGRWLPWLGLGAAGLLIVAAAWGAGVGARTPRRAGGGSS